MNGQDQRVQALTDTLLARHVPQLRAGAADAEAEALKKKRLLSVRVRDTSRPSDGENVRAAAQPRRSPLESSTRRFFSAPTQAAFSPLGSPLVLCSGRDRKLCNTIPLLAMGVWRVTKALRISSLRTYRPRNLQRCTASCTVREKRASYRFQLPPVRAVHLRRNSSLLQGRTWANPWGRSPCPTPRRKPLRKRVSNWQASEHACERAICPELRKSVEYRDLSTIYASNQRAFFQLMVP